MGLHVVAETADLAEKVAELLEVEKDFICQRELDWPLPFNTLLAIQSFSHPLFFNVLRTFLANAEKPIRLAVAREEWKDEDVERLERTIRSEYSRAQAIHEKAVAEAESLAPGAWRDERLDELRVFKTIPCIQFSTFSLSTSLKNEVDAYMSEGGTPLSITLDHAGYEVNRNAPNVHWTACPLLGEMEVTLRLIFPFVIPHPSFISALACAASSFCSSVYEWRCGILLTTQDARVHVHKVASNQIDISGRICYDELEEGEISCFTLWPLLAMAGKVVLKELSDSSNLACDYELLLLGQPLFSPPIHARAFNWTTFMNTAARCHKVSFTLNDCLVDVNLDVLFPNGVPESASSLWSLAASLSRPPISFSAPSPSLTSLSVAHPSNKGRRVSFGAIHTLGTAAVDGILQNSHDHLVHS